MLNREITLLPAQMKQKTMTDCINNGSFISVRFVPISCRLDIQVQTCSIHQKVCKALHALELGT